MNTQPHNVLVAICRAYHNYLVVVQKLMSKNTSTANKMPICSNLMFECYL